jgi:hypothetical protein
MSAGQIRKGRGAAATVEDDSLGVVLMSNPPKAKPELKLRG